MMVETPNPQSSKNEDGENKPAYDEFFQQSTNNVESNLEDVPATIDQQDALNNPGQYQTSAESSQGYTPYSPPATPTFPQQNPYSIPQPVSPSIQAPLNQPGSPPTYGQPYGPPPGFAPQTGYGPPPGFSSTPPMGMPQMPPGYMPPQYPPSYGMSPYPYPQRPYSVSTNGFAIASLVLGIIWVDWVGSVLAVIFGHVALVQIKRRQQQGRGLAIAGLVLGYIGIIVLVVVIVAAIVSSNNTG